MSVVTPRVVVVSESRITRRVVEMTFADQPLELAVFPSAAAAAADCEQRVPAALIADVVLREHDGYALARQLRAGGGADAVVLLLAGQSDAVDDAAAADVRASAVLRKPLDSHQLIDALRQALRVGPPAPAAAVADVGGAETAAAAPVDAITAALGEAVEPAVVAPVDRDVAERVEAKTDAAAAPAPGAETLVSTFHALLEVEQGLRPALEPAPLSDDEVERIARRVAALVGTTPALADRVAVEAVEHAALLAAAGAERAAERLAGEAVPEAAERVVRELAPEIVSRIAQAAVRDEIARLRATPRVA